MGGDAGASALLGRAGQRAAEDFLRRNGYEIAALNYRRARCEIDIIARRGGYTAFVEVKTLRSVIYGEPREAVTLVKQKHIIRAAWAYVAEFEVQGDLRFDVVEVMVRDGETRIVHIENAFQEGI